MRYLDFFLRAVIVVILVQTLWFKFQAAPESVAIFTALKVEPWGRILSGVVELIASLLILYPRTVLYGAVISLGTMSGAVMAHVFVLGIAVQNDGGLLFGLAVAVALASLFCIYIRRGEIKSILSRLR